MKFYKLYGPAWKFHIGPFAPEITLASPEFIQTVMSTAEPKDPYYPLISPWIGDGLLLSSGEKWARNRRLLTPSFHFDILKPYQKLFSESSVTLIKKWKSIFAENPNQSIEMFEHVSLFTLDSLMKCIFSVKSNFQSDGKKNPYIKAVYEITERLINRVRFVPHQNDWLFYFSYSGYQLRKAIKSAHDFTTSVIKQKKASKNKSESPNDTKNVRYLDFLDMLLDCRDEDGRGLTDKEIQDEVDTFMFEGHDTTASGISWCLYNLACHPDYQEKCRQEVNTVLQGRDEVTWEDLSKMVFLTQCIKESLRVNPPVPRTGRLVTKDVTLPDGRVLPKGTMVGLSIYTCHYNSDVWPDPLVYDPERFSAVNSKNRHAYSFIPFSAGPRNCIGQHFAMNELKTVIALVVKHFRLQVDETKKAQPLGTLILRSVDGVWLKLVPVM